MISQFLSFNDKSLKIKHITRTIKDSNDINSYNIVDQNKLETQILNKYLKNDGLGLQLYDMQDDLKIAYNQHNQKIGYNAITKTGDDIENL